MHVEPSNTGPIRVGALISGGGRTVMNLHQRARAGELPAEVVTVVASRDCAGIDRARQAGIEANVVAYQDFGRARLQEYSDRISALLDEARVDLVVLAGFLSMWLVPDRYAGRVMNIHPALLPSFGGKGMYGRRVHEAVLAAGCKVSGCTVHFVNNEYDAGPIVVQQAVPAYDTDSPDDLAGRVFQAECEAYPEAVKLFAHNRLSIDGHIVRVAPQS